MPKKRASYLLLGFFLVFFIFLHGESLDNFFSQDDFYHLSLARINSPKDILNFFNPWVQEDVHFRPLSTQSFFLIGHLFPSDLAPTILRLLALTFHFLNFCLVFRLLNKILGKEVLAMTLAGAYLVAPLHFLSIYYISAFQQILAAFWQLLGFWFFSLNKKKWVYLFFVLALLSKETALTFPVLLLIFSYIIGSKKSPKEYFLGLKREWRYWLILFLIAIVYGLVRIVTFARFPGESYQLSLSFRTLLSSWRWYLIWLLGAPETIINYAGRWPNFDLLAFLKDGGSWARIFLPAFLAELVLFCLAVAFLIGKDSQKFRFRQFCRGFFLFFIFFVVSLLPVSFFPYHRYAHYLDLAFFCFLLVVGKLFLEVGWSKMLWAFLFLAFLVNAWASTEIDQKLHWTPARSEIAQNYFLAFQEGNLCSAKGVYFLDNTNLSAYEASIALFFNWGPAYFCRYQPLSVYYQGINPPDDQVKTVKID